ncbi:hypothetical protein CWI38_0923p0020 [Hamiltosporidium tvaerminnensis]|uniref:Uncharacterized protein n=1 Tax=Hamiltosporidium tvaerminnensis TaxID=1176355 RepID=A0A4Q9LU35_9MICR|nr:hypothetical protein CWI38_0923p0020 [Hamiltosporidium tvaerminnensis]
MTFLSKKLYNILRKNSNADECRYLRLVYITLKTVKKISFDGRKGIESGSNGKRDQHFLKERK